MRNGSWNKCIEEDLVRPSLYGVSGVRGYIGFRFGWFLDCLYSAVLLVWSLSFASGNNYEPLDAGAGMRTVLYD